MTQVPKSEEGDCFIVKHGLDAFTFMPGLTWRSDIYPPKKPRGFQLVTLGSRWIEFAYEKDEEEREQPHYWVL